ncbi:MAG: alpha/beta fold hydrolase [Betaproteobacteria bacterium]|jgi:thioesterase domain-containing protein
MNLQPFLAELYSRNIQLWADGDRLRCKAPTGVLTTTLRDQLIERKGEILALLRSAEAVSSQPRAIVPLQPGGDRTPIFAVAGHNGDVFAYRALAFHLGKDQPFFALEPPGLDGDSEPLQRVEDLADYFAAQIQAFQPDGPYIIAGYCAGGTIAFELARQLRARGATIQLLALIASPYPTSFRVAARMQQAVVHQVARIVRHVRSLRRLSFLESIRYISAKFRRRSLLRDAEHAASLDPVLARRDDVARTTIAALRRYTPERYSGRVGLLLPNRQWLRSGAAPLHWRSVAPHAEHYFGPDGCNPDLLLVDPDAPAIADLFRRCQEGKPAEASP